MKREMKVRELIKKMVREELAGLDEAAKRDYKAEYKKFQSSDKSKKYRAELNKYNRQKETYGNGDGKDASHKGGKIVGFEKESVNRGRAEKSRLKKEGKLTEVDFNKIKLPSQVNRFLDKFVQSMKGANLNRMKRASILYKVIDAAGMTPQQLMADIQKIKTAMKEGKLTESQQVAKTILQQLGGNKFIAMTGAKNFGSSKNSLQFKIGKNSKSISHIIITLKSSDLYDVEFIRMRGTSRKVVKKLKGVYADMLQKIFTKYTGMNTRL